MFDGCNCNVQARRPKMDGITSVTEGWSHEEGRGGRSVRGV